MRLVALSLAALLSAAPALAAPKVVASVVPVHGIVSAVMDGIGAPELLLSGQLSEHRATFTPAEIAGLGKADLVFIVGHGLEAKLAQLSGTDAVNGKRFMELSESPGVATLKIREGGGWEAHDHDHAGDGHDHGHDHDHDHGEEEGVLSFDPHVWLDPENAKAMAAAVAAELAKADPANAAAYQSNAQAFSAALDADMAAIAAELAPVKDKPFIVFHDAYQYFEARFGLTGVGSISDVSAQAPSAKRLKEVRAKLAESGAVCVFREPQYESKLAETVIEGTKARTGVLDPIGADIEPGPLAYRQLLKNLATGLKACLAG